MNDSVKIDKQKKPEIEILNVEKDKLHKIRHSLAHIMAQATMERFSSSGMVKLGIGPATDEGLYYDFDLPAAISDEDLSWIENRIKEIVRSNVHFKQSFLSKEEAIDLFKDQPYKLELIDLISSGKFNEDAEENESHSLAPKLSIFQHGNFIDLCQGPHVDSSDEINPEAIRLLKVAGAYWRGQEDNQMLSRIYATAWESKESLDNYLALMEKRKGLDHRQIGKKLELFHFDESAPGMPYWLPNGLIVLNELINFWRKEHIEHGYQEFSAPIINDKRLWEISGHWEYYRENMFIVPKGDDIIYGIKPMNCPNAMVIYNLKLRSYKDLPLRLSDCDVLHRNEKSGTLHGLLRVQKFQQDDAHIFLKPDQIEEEFKNIFDIARRFYKIFNMKYSFRLSKRPSKFVGDNQEWDEAESLLESVLDKEVGAGNYKIVEGEGAFYGPKIDILMDDSLKRSWQMGTIQLDFQLPKRFKCKYVDRDGSRKNPVVIHRVIYGSIDRFIGILLEHTAGILPVWLSPEQVKILPVSDSHLDYAREINAKLKKGEIRSSVDGGNMPLSKRIRNAAQLKIPYIVVVGDKEIAARTVSIRNRDSIEEGGVKIDLLIDQINGDIESLK